MALVNWREFLPTVDVVFSSLGVPENRDSIDDDLVQLRFDGMLIDVEWVDRNGKYCVRLLKDGNGFENLVRKLFCNTSTDVVETVRELVKAHSRPIIS